MLPRIGIVTKKKRNHIALQLKNLLGGCVEIITYSLEEGIDSYINCDLILAPAPEIVGNIMKYLLPQTKVLVARRTILTTEWEKLLLIPLGTKVLVVSTYKEVSVQTVAMLYELGAYHLELIPYDPDHGTTDEFEYAITPNEAALVPSNIKNIINIGDRVLDISTLFDILHKLNLFNNTMKNMIFSYEKNIMPLSPGLLYMFNNLTDTKESFELLLNTIDYSVIAFDNDQRIKIINTQTEKLFGRRMNDVLNKPLHFLFVEISLGRICSASEIKDEIIVIEGLYYLVNKYKLLNQGLAIGGILTIKKCKTTENENLKFYQALSSRGHEAKYTFHHIRGESLALKKAVSLAKKIALTDNDILIEAESGTGKELFAQAIRNCSKRGNEPFVAFNCAALTGSLLESELFGYEEGAFTGARKNGKPGMFELANKGIIFLDEIGEISNETQVKLLRVLQEREIIRVGGTKIVPIDIRVIAATNQDLYELVKANKFRADLYFRLNVFNFKIPPLRARKGDVEYLVKIFLQENHVRRDFPQEVMQVLTQYNWPGNVRELKNCIDYMANLSEEFTIENLPPRIQEYCLGNRQIDESLHDKLQAIGTSKEILAILEILHKRYQQQQYIGRKDLSELLMKNGIFLKEQEVRTILLKLAQLDFVRTTRGRSGTKITVKGEELLRKLMA
jgi:sigma-54 dependent transcriptional regulator, acetoin dehydrogenase operon transcriptional activator AcoR